jgi:hypothetical protein
VSRHAFNRYAQRQEPGHISAMFLSHMGRCMLEVVRDAAAREDLVERVCVLLSAEEAKQLRLIAGLTPLAPDPAQTTLALG